MKITSIIKYAYQASISFIKLTMIYGLFWYFLVTTLTVLKFYQFTIGQPIEPIPHAVIVKFANSFFLIVNACVVLIVDYIFNRVEYRKKLLRDD